MIRRVEIAGETGRYRGRRRQNFPTERAPIAISREKIADIYSLKISQQTA